VLLLAVASVALDSALYQETRFPVRRLKEGLELKEAL
jgi:hypothetical protein